MIMMYSSVEGELSLCEKFGTCHSIHLPPIICRFLHNKLQALKVVLLEESLDAKRLNYQLSEVHGCSKLYGQFFKSPISKNKLPWQLHSVMTQCGKELGLRY